MTALRSRRGVGVVCLFVVASALVTSATSASALTIGSVQRLGVSLSQLPLAAVNDTGTIAYTDRDAEGDERGRVRAVNGTTVDIGTAGGAWTHTYDINNAGTVVGTSATQLVGSTLAHAYVYRPGEGMQELTPGHPSVSAAWAINDSETVAGTVSQPNSGITRATKWNAFGVATELPTLAGDPDEVTAAFDINDAGQVVGQSGLHTSGTTFEPFHPVVWDPVDGIIDLGTVAGKFPTVRRINNDGMVAGYVFDGSPRLVVGSVDDGLVDTGVVLGDTWLDLNDAGQVVATGAGNTPFVWDSIDGRVDLPAPPGPPSPAAPSALNNTGDIVGASAPVDENHDTELVKWTIESDTDLDGVLRTIEDGAANDGDGNNDGIPDRDQDEVTSLPAASGAYVTIVGPSGSSFADVAIDTPPTSPPGQTLPLGQLTFALNDVAVGGLATVEYLIPAGTAVDSFWKHDGATWSEFAFDGTTGAQISGTTASLTYQDGGRGDLDGIANGTIVDPIAAATTRSIAIGSAAVVEGSGGRAHTVQFPVTLSEPATSLVSVQYHIRESGSAVAPDDFDNRRGKAGTLRFNPSVTTGKSPTVLYVSAKVASDLLVEGEQTFEVELSNAVGGFAIAHGVATATIIDDDEGSGLRVSVGDVDIYEGHSAATVKKANNAKVWVNLSAPSASNVSVRVTVTAGTAQSGTDFKVVKSRIVSFRAGQWQKPIAIPVWPDAIAEDDETVTVSLSEPSAGLAVGRGEGLVTIRNDD